MQNLPMQDQHAACLFCWKSGYITIIFDLAFFGPRNTPSGNGSIARYELLLQNTIAEKLLFALFYLPPEKILPLTYAEISSTFGDIPSRPADLFGFSDFISLFMFSLESSENKKV